ncbi:MAG: DUF2397 domain-containing protein, partial [Lachnospiraceae bacterium]|nr:DUF2397 domain-containing protein [Lachnospiraceae bacterium]
RETESMNAGVYEEAPMEYILKPRVRNYKEKTGRTAISDAKNQKKQAREEMLKTLAKQQEKLGQIEQDGRIDFGALPVLGADVREILLKWLSDAMEDAAYSGRTEEGRQFVLDLEHANERCTVQCEDGAFTMPHIRIVFQ